MMKDPRNQARSLARIYSKSADLSPPLGYPGGPCQVIDRAHENVDNIGVLDHLVDKMEEGEDLSNPEAGKIYKTPELERGPSSHPKFISSIRITSHAQYRMDQRGVTVNEIRLFLSQFAKAFHDGKSTNSRDFIAWSEAISWGEPINWTSKSLSGLTVVFTIKSGVADIVTAYWGGLSNPHPVPEEECGYPSAGRVAGLYLASLEKRSSSTIPSPGYKTFVSPKSEMNLPSDTDTEHQRVLPLPGSATPGGAGRDIPKFEYNTPGVEPRINPRTLGVPGEEYGHPVKFDYGMPTRRTMTGGDVIMYDQDNPANNEVKQPGPNVSYRAEGPFTYVRTPDEQAGVPAGHITLTRDYTNTPPGSSRVIPDSMREDVLNFSGGNSRNAALISEVMAKCGPDIVGNSSKVNYKRIRINPKDAIITYSVEGSKGETYKVWVKGLRKGNVKTLSKMQIQVACTCNFFRWSGPEHWAKSNSFLYGKPAGTASKPEVRDPKGQNWLCKHVYAILRDHQGAKFASVSGPTRQDTKSLLESGVFPGSLVKTAKFLLNGGGSPVAPPSPKESMKMPRSLTASDRSSLIKLASSLPKGSPEKRAILAGLTQIKKASEEFNIPGKHILERARVFDNAQVSDNAKIFDRSQVYSRALVFDNAQVYGEAQVYDDAQVHGNAKVYDEASVIGKAVVHGNAQVKGEALVSGNAKVYGKAVVSGRAEIGGDAEVHGDAKVYGDAQVKGKAVVHGNARIGGTAVILGGVWDGSEGKILSGKWKAPGVTA